MKKLQLLLALSLAAALGFLLGGEPLILLIAALGAALLIVSLLLKNEVMAALGFILLVFSAALSMLKGGQPLLILSSVCASLSSWDLTSYMLLLSRIGGPANSRLSKRRLLRLGIILVCGWGLGGLTLILKLSLGFGLLLGLSLFVVLSLSISMMYLRQRDGGSN